MPKVSVVVLNWNGWKDSVECLKSLDRIKAKTFKLEIVVVDNNSSDESTQMLSNYKLKKARYTFIKNNQNLGFAGGNNVGITAALDKGAEWICVLNNDTYVDPRLIEELVSAAVAHPKAGLISPKIYFAPGFEFHKTRYTKRDMGNVIWYAGGDMDWTNVYGSNHGVDELDMGQFDKDAETDFATGACLFMSAEVAKKIGIFDEKYYLYLEDADLSVRARKAGFEILFAPLGKVWHKVSQSSGIGSELNDYFITRNRLLFGMRYASLRTKFALARESIKMYFSGRPWQRIGVRDYYLGKLGKGSWGN